MTGRSERKLIKAWSAEIAALPNYNSFICWLVLRIELGYFPSVKRIMLDDSSELVEYTPEAAYQITQFCESAINVSNVTHFHQRITPVRIHEVLSAINEIWQQDALTLQMAGMIQK